MENQLKRGLDHQDGGTGQIHEIAKSALPNAREVDCRKYREETK